jgi:hypothetical protein
VGWHNWLITELNQTPVNIINKFKVNATLNVKITVLWNVPVSTLVDRQSSKQPVVSIFRENMKLEVFFEKVVSF